MPWKRMLVEMAMAVTFSWFSRTAADLWWAGWDAAVAMFWLVSVGFDLIGTWANKRERAKKEAEIDAAFARYEELMGAFIRQVKQLDEKAKS